jgi:hypothetical protein
VAFIFNVEGTSSTLILFSTNPVPYRIRSRCLLRGRMESVPRARERIRYIGTGFVHVHVDRGDKLDSMTRLSDELFFSSFAVAMDP